MNLTRGRDFSHLMDVSAAPVAAHSATEEALDAAPDKDVTESVATEQQPADLYLAALEQKRLNQFSAARDSLEQALRATQPAQKEYAIIQDELNIELPLAQARFYLQQHDAVKVNSILEPVIGYLKTHPKRIEYMQQVEGILTSVSYLKQSQQVASKAKAEDIKRLMRQHMSMGQPYPTTKQALVALLKNYPGILDQFDIRFYHSTGETYKMVIFDKETHKEYTLEDG